MDEYTLFMRGNAEDFEDELRHAVDLHSHRFADRQFYVDRRTDTKRLRIFMVVTYPDELVSWRFGPHESKGPRTEVVHDAIICRIFSHGGDGIRIAVSVVDERAAEFCAWLVQELDRRWPGAWQRAPEPQESERSTDLVEPANSEDAPKKQRGAPRLDELEADDSRRTVMEDELRQYLRHIYLDDTDRNTAAELVGKARSTLERYRKTWPEIEGEVLREVETRRTNKVRKS